MLTDGFPSLFWGKPACSDSLLSSGKERYPVHSEMIVRQACRTEEAGRMAKQIFTAEQDGFVGAYYGGPADSRKAVILMLGDSSTDRMARCGAGWLIRNGCGRCCEPGDSKKRKQHFFNSLLAMANIQIGDGACRGRQFGRAVFIQNNPP